MKIVYISATSAKFHEMSFIIETLKRINHLSANKIAAALTPLYTENP